MEFTKIKPRNLEIEEAVLGAAMVDAEAPDVVVSQLSEASFYEPDNREIFLAIAQLRANRRPVDILTVRDALQARGSKVEVTYLVSLSNKIASSANVEYHCKILRQHEIRRACIEVAQAAQNGAYNDSEDPIELISRLSAELSTLAGSLQRKKSRLSGEIAREELARMQRISETTGFLGIPTGLKALDELLNGLQAPDLITIAARPAMGKTALALCIAAFIAFVQGKKVGFFSLEMSSEQLIRRLIAIWSNIPGTALTDPRRLESYQWDKIDWAIEELVKDRIVINDTPGLTQQEFTTEARRMKQQHGVEVIFIDYLQLMTNPALGPHANDERIVGGNSQNAKNVAKELNVPIIQLAQLSRAVEIRGGNKRPQLSDLRSSGQVEQDSDIVAFLYRPEYYQITEDAEGNSTAGLAELIVAKHRNGPTADVRLRFIGQFTKFTNWEADDFPEDDSPADARVVVQTAGLGPDQDLPF